MHVLYKNPIALMTAIITQIATCLPCRPVNLRDIWHPISASDQPIWYRGGWLVSLHPYHWLIYSHICFRAQEDNKIGTWHENYGGLITPQNTMVKSLEQSATL